MVLSDIVTPHRLVLIETGAAAAAATDDRDDDGGADLDNVMLQQILSCQCSDSQPEEDNDDAGHDEQHEEGDGDSDEGSGVETETLGDGVEVDHHLVLVILSQLELNIRWRHNLNDSLCFNVSFLSFFFTGLSPHSSHTDDSVSVSISH